MSQQSSISVRRPDEFFTFEEERADFVHHTIRDGIKKVCSTSGGTFILSWSGRVYGIGSLGSVPLTQFSKGSPSETETESHSQLLLFDSGGLEDKLFTNIVGGSNILLLFSTENELFAIGENSYSMTGQASPAIMNSLTRTVTFLDEGEYPLLAAVCFSSSLVYTSKNRVFVMGQTSWFLGESDYYLPLTYKSNKKIVSMSGAYFHANMLDEDGKVYVCGEQSDSNKLGTGETDRDLIPLDTIKEKVIIAQCAFNHSIFVTESQRVLICGFPNLSGNQYNNVPFLIELDMKHRLPMTIVTHVSSAEARVIVHTNNGVYSNESVEYSPDVPYTTGWMTNELKRVSDTFFERRFKHCRPNMVEHMKSSCVANRITFYTASHCSDVTVVRAFPRLFGYTTKMVLTNVDIVTQM